MDDLFLRLKDELILFIEAEFDFSTREWVSEALVKNPTILQIADIYGGIFTQLHMEECGKKAEELFLLAYEREEKDAGSFTSFFYQIASDDWTDEIYTDKFIRFNQRRIHEKDYDGFYPLLEFLFSKYRDTQDEEYLRLADAYSVIPFLYDKNISVFSIYRLMLMQYEGIDDEIEEYLRKRLHTLVEDYSSQLLDLSTEDQARVYCYMGYIQAMDGNRVEAYSLLSRPLAMGENFFPMVLEEIQMVSSDMQDEYMDFLSRYYERIPFTCELLLQMLVYLEAHRENVFLLDAIQYGIPKVMEKGEGVRDALSLAFILYWMYPSKDLGSRILSGISLLSKEDQPFFMGLASIYLKNREDELQNAIALADELGGKVQIRFALMMYYETKDMSYLEWAKTEPKEFTSAYMDALIVSYMDTKDPSDLAIATAYVRGNLADHDHWDNPIEANCAWAKLESFLHERGLLEKKKKLEPVMDMKRLEPRMSDYHMEHPDFYRRYFTHLRLNPVEQEFLEKHLSTQPELTGMIRECFSPHGELPDGFMPSSCFLREDSSYARIVNRIIARIILEILDYPKNDLSQQEEVIFLLWRDMDSLKCLMEEYPYMTEYIEEVSSNILRVIESSSEAFMNPAGRMIYLSMHKDEMALEELYERVKAMDDSYLPVLKEHREELIPVLTELSFRFLEKGFCSVAELLNSYINKIENKDMEDACYDNEVELC